MLGDTLFLSLFWIEYILYAAIAIAGVVGGATAISIRDDAFPAADRQTKWIWVGILMVSALVVFTRVPFLSWAGMVAIGVYWFDVRPHLKSLLSGNYGW